MEMLNKVCSAPPLEAYAHAGIITDRTDDVDEILVITLLEQNINELLSHYYRSVLRADCSIKNPIMDGSYSIGFSQTCFDQHVFRNKSFSGISEHLKRVLNARVLPHYRAIYTTFNVHLSIENDTFDGYEMLVLSCTA